MKKAHKDKMEIDYKSWVGKVVWKKTRKPFKSRLQKATVTEVMINPQSPKQKLAFTFKEDDSIVDCDVCELVEM